MKAYSQELRDRVLAACDQGQPTQQVAERFAVSPAWVRRLKQRRRETGEVAPRPAGGRRFGKVDPDELLALWAQQKDRTLEEYRQLLAEAGTHICGQTISRWLIKLGLRYKKSLWSPPNASVPTWRGDAAGGGAGNARSTPSVWSSSTRRVCGRT